MGLTRRNDLKQAGFYYKRRFGNYRDNGVFVCIYCGDAALEEDHVYPLWAALGAELWREEAQKALLPHGLLIVPSCKECNGLAGQHIFVSIPEKRRYVQSRLRHKHKKFFRVPEWEDWEFRLLSGRLQEYVKKGNAKALSVFYRTHWPATRKWKRQLRAARIAAKLSASEGGTTSTVL